MGSSESETHNLRSGHNDPENVSMGHQDNTLLLSNGDQKLNQGHTNDDPAASLINTSNDEASGKESHNQLPYNSADMSNLNNNYKPNGTTSKEEDVNENDEQKLSPSANDPKKSEDDPEVNEEKNNIRKFLKGVKADIMNKDLLPLKILFFFKYATLFVLYPFMPLHIKSLGLTATEAGINAALIPVFIILAPPFSGMVADKIGNFKVFLTGLTVLNAPLALALLLVPKAREVVILPEMLTFSFSCDPLGSYPFVLQTLDTTTCQLNSANGTLDWGRDIPSTLQCGTVCMDTNREGILPLLGQSSTTAEMYRLPDEKSIFTPYKNKKPQFRCSSTSSCTFDVVANRNHDLEELKTLLEIRKLKLLDSQYENNTQFKFGIEVEAGFLIGETRLDGESIDVQCDLGVDLSASANNGTMSGCRNECIVQLNRTLICSNPKEERVYNVALTFGLYSLLRILLGVTSATSFIMFEGAVLAILKEFGGDYGLQRVTATLAAIIFAPLSGILIQAFRNFYPAFYLYAILQVISGFLTLKIDLRFKRPTEKIIGHLKEVLTQIEILIFFCAMLLSGTSWGYIESFLFWFLEDLNASNFLMGLTISVGGLFGIPILILSRPIIKQFGHVNILCLGLVFYAIRLLGYSFIEDPWLCLPFEAMEAITASLAITAAATYAAALSSSQTIASIQGIWGGLYFGFGRGAGSLMGGFFHKWYGARNTFRIFSVMSLIGGIIYFIINIFYIEKYSKFHRKTDGLDLNDIKGDRHRRVQEEQKKVQNSDCSSEKCDGGYNGPCDVNFTDIPLDEDSPQNKSKNEHTKVINRKSDKRLANSSV